MATRVAKGKASSSGRSGDATLAAFRVELGERIRWLLDLFDSRNASAEIAGVTPEHLASYIAGRAKPPFELIGRLARAKGVSLDWIATGEGERMLGLSIPEGFVAIPAAQAASTSGPSANSDKEPPHDFYAFSQRWLQDVLRVAAENLRVVFNRGNANEPSIRDGEAMLVDAGATKIGADAFYIFQIDGRLVTKFAETYVDGRVALKTRNPEFETQILAREDAARLTVYGRVCWRAGLL